MLRLCVVCNGASVVDAQAEHPELSKEGMVPCLDPQTQFLNDTENTTELAKTFRIVSPQCYEEPCKTGQTISESPLLQSAL